MELEINCCLCGEKYKTEVDIPENWDTRYSSLYAEDGFCPKHIDVSKFADSQCPGCVGGWGDCTMWMDFAYTGRRNITEEDFKIIETGICPKRTNGTISFSQSDGIKDINISEKAKTKSGIAFANAIRDYIKKYSEK